jgi:hypothetical protein
MSTLELKERLTKLINNTDDEELLNEIYQMVSEDNEVYQLTAAQKIQITKSKNEIKSGMFSAHDEVKKRTSEWLKK